MAGVIVKNSGTLNASSAVAEGGKVFLRASQDAYVDGNGRIVATGTTGGQVEVLGNRVAVMDSASIDASGENGGGRVMVGGDFQGRNPEVQNAQVTYFGANASIRANAEKVGDGGTVIVWADDTTRAYGTIEARGGASAGNGGFVEVSGHRYLDFRGHVDTSAPKGMAGTLLLDPMDVTITEYGGPPSSDPYLAVNSGSSSYGDTPGVFGSYGTSDTSTLYWETIDSQLASSNVVVTTIGGGTTAFGDITIGSDHDYGSANDLSLLAHRHIDTGGHAINNTLDSGLHGSIVLVAGWDGNTSSPGTTGSTGSITGYGNFETAGSDGTAGGNVTLKAAGNIEVGSIDTIGYPGKRGGHITLVAGDSIWVSGSLESGRSTPATNAGPGGNISVTAGAAPATAGTISILGQIIASGADGAEGWPGGNAGNVTLAARGDIIISAPIEAIGGYGSYSWDGNGYAGGRGGDVTITSSNGIIAVLVIDTHGGNGGYGTAGSYASSGNSTGSAGGAGGDGGNITLSTGYNGGTAIALGAAILSGGNGGSGGDGGLAPYGGSIGGAGGSGGHGGTLNILANNGGVDVYGGIMGLGGNGGDPGGVNFSSGYGLYGTAGDGGRGSNITIEAALGVAVGSGYYGGPVILASGGNGAEGGGDGSGNNGGNITLTNTASGDIVFGGDIVSTGGYGYGSGSGGTGGRIEIHNRGSDTIDLSSYSVEAKGGYANGDGRGGGGGYVAIRADAGYVSLNAVNASGGGSNGGDGGDAGNISIVASGSSLSAGDDIVASGGDARGDYGVGGRGGTIGIFSYSADINISGVNANGGYADGYLARGGNGGSITLQAGLDVITSGLSAYGNYAESSDTAGGHGGSISVSAGRHINISGADAFGGYSYDIVNGAGNGGSIFLRSDTGYITTGGLDVSGGDSSYGFGGSGGSVTISMGSSASGASIGSIDIRGGSGDYAGWGGSLLIAKDGTLNTSILGSTLSNVDGDSTSTVTLAGGSLLNINATLSMPNDLLLIGGNVSVNSTVTTTSGGSIAALAGDTLAVNSAMSSDSDMLLVGGSAVNINAPVSSMYSLGVIGGSVSFDIFSMTRFPSRLNLTGTVTVGASGSLTAAYDDVGVLAGDIINDGTINGGWNTWLGVSRNITNGAGSQIIAENDVYLGLFGPTSTISFTTPSTVWAKSPNTIYLSFLARGPGGIIVNGSVASNLLASGIFFAGNPAVPAAPLVFLGTASLDPAVDNILNGDNTTLVDPCAINPLACVTTRLSREWLTKDDIGGGKGEFGGGDDEDDNGDKSGKKPVNLCRS
ncbi:MAG: hypothetical protein KJ787_00005 [Gammaproteobacteria bacterium]|nr:hypothetical protein [Gammaproteobacteria bacterium]MBU1644701.1 hypothetical protein [Gammaproteobacteria bacterium]MBU1973515.1 hypothetical protein [Gammaproteobacteria bacterium]